MWALPEQIYWVRERALRRVTALRAEGLCANMVQAVDGDE